MNKSVSGATHGAGTENGGEARAHADDRGLFHDLRGASGSERIPTMVLEDHEQIAVHVAERIARLIQSKNGKVVLGLATGSTPIGVYRELVRRHKEEGLSFKRVVTFNLDEYWPMPHDSIHSYHRFMWENLFSHVDIDPANVHIPDGTVSRDRVENYGDEYEQQIVEAGGIDFQ